MIKIILGVVLTICVISYSPEIKKYTVESGVRDQIVTYLNSWWGSFDHTPFQFWNRGYLI